MDLTSLRSGFWGYRKADVCDYIAELNENFSRKFNESYQEQQAFLLSCREENEHLKKENAAYSEERCRIIEMLADLGVFAEDVYAKAGDVSEKFFEQLPEKPEQLRQRTEEFRRSAAVLRDLVSRLLAQLNQEESVLGKENSTQ